MTAEFTSTSLVNTEANMSWSCWTQDEAISDGRVCFVQGADRCVSSQVWAYPFTEASLIFPAPKQTHSRWREPACQWVPCAVSPASTRISVTTVWQLSHYMESPGVPFEQLRLRGDNLWYCSIINWLGASHLVCVWQSRTLTSWLTSPHRLSQYTARHVWLEHMTML